MAEFGIPYELWFKLPLTGDRNRVGYNDLLEALQLKYKLEKDIIDKSKKGKGIDLEFA